MYFNVKNKIAWNFKNISKLAWVLQKKRSNKPKSAWADSEPNKSSNYSELAWVCGNPVNASFVEEYILWILMHSIFNKSMFKLYKVWK